MKHTRDHIQMIMRTHAKRCDGFTGPSFFLMHGEQQYSKTVETFPSSHGRLSASTDINTIVYIKHYATI
jgi:hypothetical protein